MRKESYKFFQDLLTAPSPSGYEQPAQRVFRAYVSPFAQVSQDVLGNVYGTIPASGTELPRVMLVGHSDEIGLQVKYMDDNGFLFFGAIGGVDAHLTPGQRVNIHTLKGGCRG